MKLNHSDLLLYAVTDRTWLGNSTLLEQVEESILGGVTCVQLREKDLDFQNFLSGAKEMKALCNKYKIPFIINDSLEIALESGADGVHIGQSDQNAKEVREKLGDSRIMGVSVQTVEQAKGAVADGADYLGVGAVFSTSTKLDAHAVSLATLKEITAFVEVPVVAIGGISLENIHQLEKCGLSGVAVVSGIFASSDIKRASESFVLASQEVVR
ncbi:MAG: thiamine phosphate synthase [Eubacteriales bacterium]